MQVTYRELLLLLESQPNDEELAAILDEAAPSITARVINYVMESDDD